MEKYSQTGLDKFFPDPARLKEFAPQEPLENKNITRGRVLYERMRPLVGPIHPLF